MRAESGPAKKYDKTFGRSATDAALELRGKWDPHRFGIYHALRKVASDTQVCGVLERCRDILGRTVTAWELEPGRTEAEVLDLLAKAAAKGPKPAPSGFTPIRGVAGR